MTKPEQKSWILLNWSSLMRTGKLSEALRRYWSNKNQRDVAAEAKEVFDINDKP